MTGVQVTAAHPDAVSKPLISTDPASSGATNHASAVASYRHGGEVEAAPAHEALPPNAYNEPLRQASACPNRGSGVSAIRLHVFAAGSYRSQLLIPPQPAPSPPVTYRKPPIAAAANWKRALAMLAIGVHVFVAGS